MSLDETARFISTSPAYGGGSIDLHACDVGQGLVQQLATKMGKEVTGPTEKLWSVYSWEYGTYPKKEMFFPFFNNFKVEVPDFGKPGKTVTYDAEGKLKQTK